jgi:hypothetical protein
MLNVWFFDALGKSFPAEVYLAPVTLCGFARIGSGLCAG